MTADAMLELIEELAVLTGEPLITPEGMRRFGRHSWRGAGAVRLTGELNLSPMKVSMIARWDSDLILHYARLAQLKGIAEDVKKALVDKGDQDKQVNLVAKMREVTKILNKQQVTYDSELKSIHDKNEED